jgi:cytoskeletal protein CcmA (bactofilin family)
MIRIFRLPVSAGGSTCYPVRTLPDDVRSPWERPRRNPDPTRQRVPLIPRRPVSVALALLGKHPKRRGGLRVAFRRDSKVDAFQRQISALRNQLGGETDHYREASFADPQATRHEPEYRNDFPDLDSLEPKSRSSLLRDLVDSDPSPGDVAMPELPAIPSIDTQTTVVAHSTAWSGTLESAGSLHIHGRVEGTLTAQQDIFIAEEAEVDATIIAASVTIAGQVRGSIHCSHRFEILPHGRVSADVRAPAIVIHDGALLAGEITMTASGESRGKIAAVPAARAAHSGD